MARRTSKLTKKRGKPRHRERRQYPYEDWPAFKPVPGTDGRLMELDLNELTPEQRAEWDRASAEGERLRELHERVGKKLEYRQNVRDGLLPPAWVSAPMSAVAATPLLPAAITPVPDVQQQPARYVAAPEWIAGEARRLKRANAIPASIIDTIITLHCADSIVEKTRPR